MARDHRKLHVFCLADSLLIAVYGATRILPASERFGLQGQLRRSALSAATNIVEGSARRTLREYVSFLNVASGSTAEVVYLLSVARRLGYLDAALAADLEARYRGLLKSLRALQRGLGNLRD